MHSFLRKETCRVLAASVLVLSFQCARAETAVPSSAREQAAAQLQSAGVAPDAARERVRNLGDQEVTTLSQDMASAPAGGVAPLGWVAITVAVGMLYFFVVRK